MMYLYELDELPICTICDVPMEQVPDKLATDVCILCKREKDSHTHWICRGPHLNTIVALRLVVPGAPEA